MIDSNTYIIESKNNYNIHLAYKNVDILVENPNILNSAKIKIETKKIKKSYKKISKGLNKKLNKNYSDDFMGAYKSLYDTLESKEVYHKFRNENFINLFEENNVNEDKKNKKNILVEIFKIEACLDKFLKIKTRVKLINENILEF